MKVGELYVLIGPPQIKHMQNNAGNLKEVRLQPKDTVLQTQTSAHWTSSTAVQTGQRWPTR